MTQVLEAALDLAETSRRTDINANFAARLITVAQLLGKAARRRCSMNAPMLVREKGVQNVLRALLALPDNKFTEETILALIREKCDAEQPLRWYSNLLTWDLITGEWQEDQGMVHALTKAGKFFADWQEFETYQ